MAPRGPRRGGGDLDLLRHELLQEKAANLARLGRRLEDALAELRAFDAHPAAPSGEDAARRDRLVAAAGEALWYYVVQREVCGLHGDEALMRQLDVPREVRLRMGFVPAARGPDRRS